MSMSLLQLAARMTHAAAHVDVLLDDNLEKACKVLKASAQHAIGTYEFGWKPLAASTLARKSADTPLFETGALKDSIEFNVAHREAYVGTSHFVAAWQEFGTRSIPPRPFMGGALNAKQGEIRALFGHAMVVKLLAP